VARRVVHFHPEAIAEARAAAQWYRERNTSAADAFLADNGRLIPIDGFDDMMLQLSILDS
jgi:hypothetical protein